MSERGPSKYPLYLGNVARQCDDEVEVLDKYTGDVIAHVSMANQSVIEEAIAAAVRAQPEMQELAPFERQKILQHCVDRFQERFEELAQLLCAEAGKPIKDSRGEVSRLIDTFKIAAEEALRIDGEVLTLEISARARGYRGMTARLPIGPCSFISPFNFPLNLAAHKIAPAIAAGCAFVLKPATLTPLGALTIAEVLSETDLPKGAFSVLPCRREAAASFTTDERLKLLSFTGSPEVGWRLKEQAGKKKVVLELGGNAACIVEKDAHIDDAVERLIVGAFYQSGQSCISVQRILVQEEIYDRVKSAFVSQAQRLVMGDPRDEKTFIGPMISEHEARRLEHWITSALDAGAKLLCGGAREGSFVPATVLENVPRSEALYAQEAFGPVALLSPYRHFDEALAEVNDSCFGLQAGLFTGKIDYMLRAWKSLQVGGVIVGDVPSWRVDNMPYGGVKDSGFGREGIRYSIEDMTEPRLLVLREEHFRKGLS